MKKEAYYFSHDANARNDVKILRIRRQIGAEAYAAYFMTIEVLREQVDFKLPLDSIPDLAYQFNISEEKVKAVIINFGLFEFDDNFFSSLRLLRSMDEYNERKNKYIEAGRKGGQASVKHRLSIAQAIKGKERKVNKRRVESRYIPPSLIEIKTYFFENGYSYQSAEKAFKYYNDANWVDSRGNKVKNWKQKMQGVWFKDENLKNGKNKEYYSSAPPLKNANNVP